jgi:hypothetical protein
MVNDERLGFMRVLADQHFAGDRVPDPVAEFSNRGLLQTVEAVFVENLLLLVDRHQQAKVRLVSPMFQQPRLDIPGDPDVKLPVLWLAREDTSGDEPVRP